ncbi:hypothetical protein PGTUg99_013903 [Puccinia graminis f. sp. tritici]|uniref:RRM domain-containing protein n=2 Tax=Puccinia graminis f. sp. tritici TaxID=56615 RepID=A0A5B0S3Q9_PUCGR|nr:hypothetical protein PGTUg99_013903 [Puccinia graminis f. sp. tritici]
MDIMPESSSSATNHHHHHHQHQPISLNIQSGSRVLISGLPADVTGSQLHELFDQTVQQVHKVEVYYDQSGISRGIALIEFHTLEAALRSHQQFHGKLIDKVSTITVEIVAVPAPPALEPPPPPPPVRTTTIKPAPSYQQQLPPDHQPVAPLAPRAKNYAKPRPPPSKLSLKQRLALPTPPPPRRFLFNTPASGTKGSTGTQKKGKPMKQKQKPFPAGSLSKKPRHSKANHLQSIA